MSKTESESAETEKEKSLTALLEGRREGEEDSTKLKDTQANQTLQLVLQWSVQELRQGSQHSVLFQHQE